MKNRIKQFCDDHEIITATALMAFGVTGFVVSTHFIAKAIEGLEVDAVKRRTYEDGAMDVAVILKNGMTKFYHWDPKPV